MTELANKVLEIMKTAEGKSSFSKTEFKEYNISDDDAEIALKELEQIGYVKIHKTYINGTLEYKLK